MNSEILRGVTVATLALAAGMTVGCSSLSARGPGLVPVSQVEPPRDSADAVVVMVRASQVGDTYAFPIEDEQGEILAYSTAHAQFALHLEPGARSLSLRAHGYVDVLSAELAAGRTYYVSIELRPTPAGLKWTLVPLRKDDLGSKAVQEALKATPAFRVDRDLAKHSPPRSGELVSTLAPTVGSHTLRIDDGQ